jgi:hypothetical protein
MPEIALDVGGEDRHALRAKPSAMTWSVTVLPVPVAPVTRPWRLASFRVSNSGLWLLPTRKVPSGIVSFSAMTAVLIWSRDLLAALSGVFRQCEHSDAIRHLAARPANRILPLSPSTGEATDCNPS